MKGLRICASLSACGLLFTFATRSGAQEAVLTDQAIREAFRAQSIELSSSLVDQIRPRLQTAGHEKCAASPTGPNSKVKFAAVEVAQQLGLNPKVDHGVVARIVKAIEGLSCPAPAPHTRCAGHPGERCLPPPAPPMGLDWPAYYHKTLSLNSNQQFLSLVGEKGFSPVRISWEDIGRYENSVWGDRISDVGIWVRLNEKDPNSAQLALSVRRDSNFRDKVLMVPSENIKIHLKENERTRETTLRDRLRDLGLTSETKDANVIVSNQFAVVPVPSPEMWQSSGIDTPARSAFNFSIFPYGSTNFVITDVIEGSSEAVVGPGNHQLLFADIGGKKVPFTASRAAERQDLLKLESELRAQGMDVDVQRYYLIQIPLKRNAPGIVLSNMGTPPVHRAWTAMSFGGMAESETEGASAPAAASNELMPQPLSPLMRSRGMDKVAIGHGEIEGDYQSGSGFRGARAEEPIRVTVVYFVTPVGEVTREDMDQFARTFESWDGKAIWGGSFVTKE